MAGENIKLGLLISATGSKQTVAELLAIQAASKRIADEAPGIARLASAFGISGAAAQKLAKDLNKTPDQILEIAQSLKAMERAGASSSQQLLSLAAKFGITAEQAKKLRSATKGGFEGQTQQVSALGGGVAELAFKFNNVVQSIQSVLAAAKPAYDFLIGSNEELNAQILRSQANLAGATRVFQGNTEVTDPTEKIKATGPAISAALKQVEKDTQSLVGVTSQQVNQFFDSTLQNAGRLVNQSKEFGDPIKSATALTKGFAASFKVLGLEAGQIQSEIRSVLTGEELDNSTLAKGLQITRQNIQEWRGQGVLVDELNKRLQVYVAANKIAANSIAGAGSNVKDIFERVGREAGKPLLDPLIDQLNKLFFFLADNEQSFISFFTGFTQGAVNVGGQVFTALKPVIDKLIDVFEQAAPLAESLFNLIGTGAIAAAEAISAGVLPVLLTVTVEAAKALNNLAELVQLRQINDAADALEILTKTTDAYSQAAIDTGSALKALNKIQSEGGKLTAEQEARQKQLAASAKLQVASIDEQIAALKALNPVSADNREQRDAQVRSLEAVKAALGSSSGAIRIEGQELKKLGTSYEQLSKKTSEAENAIANAQNGQEASKAAKDLTGVIEQRAELGQITADQAEESLLAIANNATLEVDVQQKAVETISKIRKSELQRQTQDIDAQLAAVQIAADAGKKSPLEAAQEITRLKKQQLDLQTQDIQNQITDEQAAIAAGTGSKNKLTELQTQQKKLNADRQKEEGEGEKRVQEARINEIEQANTKALAVATLTETRKNTELAKLQASGTITAREAEGKKLENTQARIQSELKAEQTKLAALQALTASNPAQAKKLEADRAASEQKIAALQGQSAQNEIAIRKNALDQITQATEEARQKLSLTEKQRFAELAELEAQGKITKEQVESEKATLTEARIGKELALERELLAKLQAQPRSEERDKAIVQSQTKIAEQRIALVESVAKKEEAIRKAALDKIEKANKKVLDAIELAGQERLISTQQLINKGVISEEKAAQQKANLRTEQLKAELSAAQQQQAELSRLAQGTKGKSREEAEKAVTEARKKTNGLTLQLLEAEKSAQDELAKVAIAAIDKQLAAKNRQYDAELSKLAQVKQSRASATQVAEIAAQRETAAVEVATKAIERQSELLKAKANLVQATTAAATSEKQIEVDRAKRAVEVRKALEGQNVSAQERAALERELASLGASSQQSTIQLLQKQYQLENQLAAQKREALLAEQAQAQAQLELDLKRNQLAANRAVIEARIGELKAKAAVADAQSALQEQRVSSQRAIAAAQANLSKAQKEKNPESIAQAQSELKNVQSSAVTGQQQAQDGIALAQQQAGLATQNTQEAIAQKAQSVEVEALTRKTLEVQQQSALKQFEAAEAARLNAQNLEAARTAAEGIAAAMERAKAAQPGGGAATNQAVPANLPGRRDGGSVAGGSAYIVGETEPEVFVPGVSGTILNQAQIAKNLTAFQAAQSIVGIRPISAPTTSPAAQASPLVDEIKGLREDIQRRPPPSQSNAFTIVGEASPYDRALELQRKMTRQRTLFDNP